MAAGDAAGVLDQVARLATVEHALCVEYLRVAYLLGHGLGKPPAGAQTAIDMAQVEMSHLHRVNDVLALAGRHPEVGRATGIGPDIRFEPLGPAEQARLGDREAAIAAAVDAAWAALRPAVAPEAAVFEGALRDLLDFVLASCTDHAGPVAGLTPAIAVRVPGREPADEAERRLQALSDGHYHLVVDMVEASFAHDEQLGGELLTRAVADMGALDDVNGVLVRRGLLPPFTARPA
jgi:hypothetical protein